MDNINDILNRYFEGESSIEEEKLLCQYFRNDDVRTEHKAYSAIFQYIEREKSVNNIVNSTNTKRIIPFLLGIVACAAILLGLFIINTLQEGNLKSVVYVDGKKINSIEILNTEALNSIMSIDEDIDTDTLESQIDLLESFTE